MVGILWQTPLLASLSLIITTGIVIKIVDISYNLASNYDVQMCKRHQLLGNLSPKLPTWTMLAGAAQRLQRWGVQITASEASRKIFCCTPQKGVQISFCAIQQGVQNHCKNYP